MQTERRHDLATADHIREALHLQRDLGFEAALLMLRARGVSDALARDTLRPYRDRRAPRPA